MKETKQSKVEIREGFEVRVFGPRPPGPARVEGDEGLRGQDGGEARGVDRGDPRLLQEDDQSTVSG